MKTLLSLTCLIFSTLFYTQGLLAQVSNADSVNKVSSILVVNPKGQETFKEDSVINIQWMIDNSGKEPIKFVRIEYSIDSGKSWNSIYLKVQAALGSISWKAPKINKPAPERNTMSNSERKIFDKRNPPKKELNVRILVTDHFDRNIADTSNVFTIGNRDEETKHIVHILLLGSGDFETAFSSAQNKDQAKDSSKGASNLQSLSVTNGSLGFLMTDSAKFEASASVSFSAVNDTVIGNYGSSVLIPKKGSSGINLSLKYNPWNDKEHSTFMRMLGFYTTLNVSSGLWGYSSSVNPASISGNDTTFLRTFKPGNSSTVKIVNYAFSLGVHLIFPGVSVEKNKSPFKAELSFGFALRTIGGDIKVIYDGNAYNQLLGTDELIFPGFQWNLKLIYENFSVSAGIIHLTALNGRNNITGLTTTQLLTTIEFKTLINLFDFPF